MPGWCVRKCLMVVLLPGDYHNCRGRSGRAAEGSGGKGEKWEVGGKGDR